MGKSVNLVYSLAAAALLVACGAPKAVIADVDPSKTARITLTTGTPVGDRDTVWITGYNPELGGWSGRGLSSRRVRDYSP